MHAGIQAALDPTCRSWIAFTFLYVKFLEEEDSAILTAESPKAYLSLCLAKMPGLAMMPFIPPFP